MEALAPIADLAELEAALAASRQRPLAVMKHSLICGASAAAREQILEAAAQRPEIEWREVRIQEARELSRQLAQRSGVRHESPQLLVFQDGRLAWHASHWRLTTPRILAAVDEILGAG